MVWSFLKLNCRTTSQHIIAQARNISDSCKTKKSVLISQSNDIYTNLAVEDWLYKNSDFSNHHILMLWQNDPCVVVGRHQNPWLEANIPSLTKLGVQLARRNSGGGTVYHDKGNLNLTFFTARERYNRKDNLKLIARVLFKEFGVSVVISSREDLTLRNIYKISGTAAKLGRPNAYHHCSLLVNVNKLNLSRALQKGETGITTNAAKSVPALVMNLCEEIPSLTVDYLMEAIGLEYLQTVQDEFQIINPTDQLFPGLTTIRNLLSSWEWCYGKTPDFTINRCFPVPDHFLCDTFSSNQELKITMQVKRGHITDVVFNISPTGLQGDMKMITPLKGCKFTEEVLKNLESSLTVDNMLTDDNKIVTAKSTNSKVVLLTDHLGNVFHKNANI